MRAADCLWERESERVRERVREMAESGRNEISWLKGERVRSHDNEDENGDRGKDKCLNLVKPVSIQIRMIYERILSS